MKFVHWNKVVPTFDFDVTAPFFALQVPTVDTVRYSAILEMLLEINKGTFFTGETGVGKSVIIQNYIANNQDSKSLSPVFLNFSAQTTSKSTQKSLESKLEKKKGKKYLGAKGLCKLIVFVDDINMPAVETYGAQPPIELLRQLVDKGGFYDRDKLFWKNIEKCVMICAAAPPSGGRSPLTPRFMRHFHVFCVQNPTDDSLKVIFEGIINGFLTKNSFSDAVKKAGTLSVQSTVDLFT
jgi:dynein heavy chain